MTTALRRILAATALALLAGCSVLPPASIQAKKAMLSKLPGDVPQGQARAATLMVFAPETRPIYDTTQMAYMAKPYQIDFFSQHEWGETPSQMLHPLLVKMLESTHAFAAVLIPSSQGRYRYALRTEIAELVQDFNAEPAELKLTLRLQLSDASGAPMASKEIALREPMRQTTPEAGVDAANDAVSKALREIAAFVLEKAR